MDQLTNTIDYITIASEGNAIDFGDLTVADFIFLVHFIINSRYICGRIYSNSI
jgi:hypothetical protein